jgi:hypothetical protein
MDLGQPLLAVAVPVAAAPGDMMLLELLELLIPAVEAVAVD